MKVTVKEALNSLEDEVVEYIINTPHNTNPSVVRSMISSAGQKVQSSSFFYLKLDKDGEVDVGSYKGTLLGSDNQTQASIEDLVFSTLDHTAKIFIPASEYELGLEINGVAYAVNQPIGFRISESDCCQLDTRYTTFVLRGQGVGEEALLALEKYYNLHKEK